MAASVASIQAHLDRILRFLQPHSMFVNCHMVGYLTDDHWQTYIPECIRKHINSKSDIDSAIEVFWEFHRNPERIKGHSFGGLVQFLKQSQHHRLENGDEVALSVDQLNQQLSALGFQLENNSGLQIKEFMSEKKNHEVAIAALVVSNLCGDRDGGDKKLSVIDAGDGKGYLSSRLALEYRLSVLGIDANPINTTGAEKRTAQLERAWTGLTKRAKDVLNGKTPPKKGRRKRANSSSEERPATNLNYQRSTHFITPSTDFISLFQSHYPSANPSGFCLSGLHTCGNLASSCLEIFQHHRDIRCLCNVGCCYHLLDEQFAQNDFFVERHPPTANAIVGFPLSQHLKNQQYAMGRNGRMLAAQSLDRTCDSSELPNASLFYRALLETLIVRHDPSLKNCVQVGRMKKVTTFADYVRKCANRTSLELGAVDDQVLEGLLQQHEFDRKLMDLFYLLRMTFAPVLESLVLLDRLLYLRESGVENAFLVKLFDPVVSPRCYAVVSVK